MTKITYEFYLQRELYYEKCELSFDVASAFAYEKKLQGTVIQSGSSGMLRGLIDSAVSKIQAFRGVSEEETQWVVDQVINAFEVIPLAVQDLAGAQSGSQVVGALMRAYKMITRSNIVTGALDMGAWILDELKEFSYREFMTSFGSHRRTQSGDVCIQSGELQWVIDGAKSLIGNYKAARDSAAVKKLQEMLLYFLSFGLFKNMGLTYERAHIGKLKQAKLKEEYSSIEGFVLSIVETTVWLLERGMQAVKLGSFSPFLHSSESYSKWADRSYRVIEDAQKMSSAAILLCPDAGKHSLEEREKCERCQKFGDLDEHSFTQRLQSCLEDGEAMLKYADEAVEKRLIKYRMSELRVLEARYLSKDMAQRDRKPPFSLLVSGESSVAKTMFMNICFLQYGKVHGKNIDAECMWTRNPTDQFYSGFKASKWCIRIDDIAMFNPAATPLDPTLADVILISNGVSFVAPMADLDDKGVIPVRPDLLLASTNTEHLNAHCYFSYPVALRRRFPYVVELSIRREFCIPGTNMLDPATVSVDPEEYQNIWNIHLKKLLITKNGNLEDKQAPVVATFETIGEWTDIYDFLKVFSRLSLEHKFNQERAEATVTNMRRITCCKRCFMPPHRCECQELQTRTVSESSSEGVPPVSDLERNFLNCWAIYQASDRSTESYVEFLRRIKMAEHAEVPKPSHFVSFTDDEQEISELEYDSDDEVVFDDRRSWMTKSLDMVDDTVDVVKTIASSLALGVKEATWRVSDNIMQQASDLMVFYQVRKIKLALASAGERIYQTFYNWKIAAFCAFAVSFFATWKGVSFIMSSLIQVQTDDEQTPVVKKESGKAVADFVKDEKPNPWIKDELILSEFQVPSKSRGWQSLSLDAIYTRLKSSVAHVDFSFSDDNGSHHIPAVAFCVIGHIWMTNNHCIPTVENMVCKMTQEPETGNVGKNLDFSLSQTSVVRVVEHDVAFFWCVSPPKMDATELFMKQSASGMVCNGFYIHCDRHSYPERNNVRAIRTAMDHVIAPINRDMKVCWGSPDRTTEFGDCGSPLVGMTQLGPVILGIHQQLNGRSTGATQILREDIDKAVAFFGRQVQCGVPNLKDDLGSLHMKSVLRWPNEGQAHVYGSTAKSAWRQAPKSKVVDTFISEAAQKRGFVKRCTKPVMTGPEVWHKNVEPTLTQKFMFDKGVLDKCVKSYVQDILKGLSTDQLSEIVHLDDKITMNGYPGVKFLDKINRQTSMGYPYRKSKSNFLLPCEEDGIYSDAVEYVEEIMDEVRLIREVYTRNERYMPVFIMSLKDEPIPLPKALIKKTRGFMGGPAAWQFVYRQELLSFVRMFQLNPFLFEGAPGMNCNSCQWEHLYKYLTKFGEDRLVAGDYAKFDKRMSPMFILAAFDVIIEILVAAKRDPMDIQFVRCMANDVAYPLTDVQGDYVEFFGSNPSGHALTVIINCLVNALYMRYCYHELNPEHRVDTFKDHVALITYGDDNAQGVSSGAPWYNHTSISNMLAKFDVVYTMADKESASVPYIHIDEVSFLKRTFRIVDGRMACPLEWSSIDKMLTACVASRSVCPEEQSIQSMRSAVGEFFQYGREVFDKNVSLMKEIVEECGLQAFVTKSTFPSYLELEEAHYDAGKGCAACLAVVL